MRVKLFLITTLLLVLIAGTAFARTSRYEKLAQELELQGDYAGAISMYTQKSSVEEKLSVMVRVAECYRSLKDYENAEIWLEKVVARTESSKKYLYSYAEILVRNGKIEKAKEIIARDSLGTRQKNLLAACDSLAAQKEQAPVMLVRNVESLNSCYDDWGFIPVDETRVIFSSNRDDITPWCGGDKEYTLLKTYDAKPSAKGEGADTIYDPNIAFRDIHELPKPVNLAKTHSGPAAFSRKDPGILYYSQTIHGKGQNQTVIVGRNEKKRTYVENLGIFSLQNTAQNSEEFPDDESDVSGPAKATPFENNNPKNYSVAHPCLSNDGKYLYFSSDMPGGQGGKDLWYCERSSSGWGRPVNCGKQVNTPDNEVFPTMDSDGNLYFSSDGFPGMGNLDIFMVEGSKDKWKNRTHLPAPINSVGDDFFLVKIGDNLRGYFSSDRAGGKGGDDIYTFAPYEEIKDPVLPDVPLELDVKKFSPVLESFNVAQVPLFDAGVIQKKEKIIEESDTKVHVVPLKTINIVGRVMDAKTQEALRDVKICATHNNTRTSVCEQTSPAGLANFDVMVNSDYTISAFKEGYMSTVPIRLSKSDMQQGHVVVVEMQKRTKSSFRSAEDVVEQAKVKRKSVVRKNQKEYRVQVLATEGNALDWAYFDKLRRAYPQFEIEITKRDRAKRYTYGSFDDSGTAKQYMRRYMSLGYTDCFVAVFVNGKQIGSLFSGGAQQRVKDY